MADHATSERASARRRRSRLFSAFAADRLPKLRWLSLPYAPVPPDVDAFLRRPNHAVIASLRPDGSPHTAPTWYDWKDGRALVNMDESRLRLRFMRQNPNVALTALDHADWSRHVSLLGRIIAIEDDVGLRDIDRLAVRYTGEPFPVRNRLRFSAVLDVSAWHGWQGAGPWPLS